MNDQEELRRSILLKSNQTFLLPLFSRAAESGKRKPLLTDLKAVEVAGKLKPMVEGYFRPPDNMSHYAFIFRTICFDRLIRDFIWRYPNGTVVNIGCGLDSTFERLNPGEIRWYDLDHPDIIELRRKFFNETEKRKFISTNFLDEGWLREIIHDNGVLVFACGVYYYYSEKAIRKFFAGLSHALPSFELLFDITSPAGVRAANHVIRKSGMTDGPWLLWEVRDYRTILKWNPRSIFLGRYRIFYLEGCRPPMKCLIPGLISDALSIEQILHLRIRHRYQTL